MKYTSLLLIAVQNIASHFFDVSQTMDLRRVTWTLVPIQSTTSLLACLLAYCTSWGEEIFPATLQHQLACLLACLLHLVGGGDFSCNIAKPACLLTCLLHLVGRADFSCDIATPPSDRAAYTISTLPSPSGMLHTMHTVSCAVVVPATPSATPAGS